MRIIFTLLMCLSTVAACDTKDVQVSTADLRPPPDLRMNPGNPAVGQACYDTMPCPDVGGKSTRCAVVLQNDPVGVCAPSCSSNADCDSAMPGKPFCTEMPLQKGPECVLFCNVVRKDDGSQVKICPPGWTCQDIPGVAGGPGYEVCRPPQVRAVPDMM